MAGPVITWAMAGRTAALAAIGGTAAQAASLTLTPISRSAQYALNRGMPNLMPTFEQYVTLWSTGRITWSVLEDYVDNLGIPVPNASGGGPGNTPVGRHWDALADSMAVRAPIAAWVNWARTTTNSDTKLEHEMLRQGVHSSEQRGRILDPREPLPITFYIDALNRGYGNEDFFVKSLARSGITQSRDIQIASSARYQIPPISDLIHFAVREVWDQNVVERFDYDLEFPSQLQHWAEKQGFGWKPGDAGLSGPGVVEIEWPKLYWRAHWQMMSPSQASEALHRLRPSNFVQTESRVEGVRPFTIQDFDTVLKIADYPPIIREWLRGLTYRPLTRIDLRRAFRIGSITKADVYEGYRDLSYDDTRAQILADFTERDETRRQQLLAMRRQQHQLRRSFLLGLLTEHEFRNQFYRSKLIMPSEITDFDKLDPIEQARVSSADQETDRTTATVNREAVNRVAQAQLDAIKRVNRKGALSSSQLETALRRIGLTGTRLDQWVVILGSISTAAARDVTPAHLLRLHRSGIIDTVELILRLKNLGFTDADTTRMADLNALAIRRDLAKAAEKRARTAQGRERALRRQAESLRKESRRVEQEFRRQASTAAVERWYARGLVSHREAVEMLVERGIEQPYAFQRLEDARQRKGFILHPEDRNGTD